MWAKLRQDPLRQTARIVRRQLCERGLRRQIVNLGKNAVTVPAMLQPPSLKYAGYGGPWFEEFFQQNYAEFESDGATYLPILWDNFFAQAQAHSYWPGEFAQRFRAMWSLLGQLGREDRTFFTVLGIYDFPIWNWHLFPKNVVVLAANGYGDVAIPLLKGDLPFRTQNKDIRLSFLGRTSTHPLRERMHQVFKEAALFGEGQGWEQTMARSAFSLCPRGLGPASFRTYEALSMGSVPVYIWEKRKWLPYEDALDWSKISIVAEASDMGLAKERIERMSDAEVSAMQAEIARVYDAHFRYGGVARHIQSKVSAIRTRNDAVALTVSRKDFAF
ncbi:MAG: exostosin family protein [Chthoniobacterales bacterium]